VRGNRESLRETSWTDRLARVLTFLVLAATGALVLVFAVIALNPAVPFNPYPPTTPFPPSRASVTTAPETRRPTALSTRSPFPSPTRLRPATATRETRKPTALPARSPFPSPTPLRPATLLPTPEPAMPFSSTVEGGTSSALLDCDGVLVAGIVLDAEGEALTGYPVHVWGPGVDTIVVSGSAPAYGPSGWEAAATETEDGDIIWNVQLHVHNIYQAHPPVSGIVRVELPRRCPQAMLLFRERP
jgi:hypothetical protein